MYRANRRDDVYIVLCCGKLLRESVAGPACADDGDGGFAHCLFESRLLRDRKSTSGWTESKSNIDWVLIYVTMIYAFNLFPLVAVLDRVLAAPSEPTNVLDIAPCKMRVRHRRRCLRTLRSI